MPGVDPAPGARKIIFNQNHFYTYATWDGPLDGYPGWSPAPAVWAVSEEPAAGPPRAEPFAARHGRAAARRPGRLRPRRRASPESRCCRRSGRTRRSCSRRLLAQDPRVPPGSVHVLVDVPRAEVVRVLAEAAVFVCAVAHGQLRAAGRRGPDVGLPRRRLRRRRRCRAVRRTRRLARTGAAPAAPRRARGRPAGAPGRTRPARGGEPRLDPRAERPRRHRRRPARRRRARPVRVPADVPSPRTPPPGSTGCPRASPRPADLPDSGGSTTSTW